MDEKNQKLLLKIGGMTCVNCQNKIEKALKQTKGVVSASVSYNNMTADIVYDKERISPKEIIAVIQCLDYEAASSKKTAAPNMTDIVSTLLIIISLYAMLQAAGILNLLAPSRLADTNMGYGMLFITGLLTSVHCVAMCGGINLSQCVPQKAGGGRKSTYGHAAAYNVGRVLSYTAAGFVFGLVGLLIGGGAEVGISIFMQGALKITAGLFMVIMGVNMLGLFPWLRKLTVCMPRFLARRIETQKARTTRPFIVGILNGFMPCGPLQSMWIVALAAGNPLVGGLSMFLFGIGTVPLMLGLGSLVSALGRRFADKVMRVGAVLVVVLGLAMLSQGGLLSGLLPPGLLLILVIALCAAGVLLSVPVEKKTVKNTLKASALAVVIGSCAVWSLCGSSLQTSSGGKAEVVDGMQVVSSTLSSGNYPNITVQAGVPVKWVIDAPEGSINGCNYRIVIGEYGIEYTFHTGENIIEFTPTNAGTVDYNCWMGMIYGKIFVTDGA